MQKKKAELGTEKYNKLESEAKPRIRAKLIEELGLDVVRRREAETKKKARQKKKAEIGP